MGTFKKSITSILSVAVISLSATSMSTISAANIQSSSELDRAEVLPIKAEIQEEIKAQFQIVVGTIKSISDHGSNGDMQMIAVETAEGNPIHLIVSENTFFLDDKELEEGMEIIAYYDALKPVIMIYPPQYGAEVIAVVNDERNVKVDHFDENLISSDNTLKLHVSDETKVIYEDGTPYDGELAKRNLAVTYDVSTRSIPAQATPIQIVVLNEEEQLDEAGGDALSEQSIGLDSNDRSTDVSAELDGSTSVSSNTTTVADHILESVESLESDQGHTMVPLRKVAESLGYYVAWHAVDQTIKVGRDISIKVGEGVVKKQSEQLELETAPTVIDGVTYVPASFFDKFLQN